MRNVWRMDVESCFRTTSSIVVGSRDGNFGILGRTEQAELKLLVRVLQ